MLACCPVPACGCLSLHPQPADSWWSVCASQVLQQYETGPYRGENLLHIAIVQKDVALVSKLLASARPALPAAPPHVCTAVQSYCAAARCPPSLSHRPCIDVSASKRGAMECELLFLLADELTIKAQLAARAVGTFFLPQQAPLEEDPTDWVRNTTTRGVPVLSGTNFRTA